MREYYGTHFGGIEVVERGSAFPRKRVHLTQTSTGRARTAEAPIVVVAGGATALILPALRTSARIDRAPEDDGRRRLVLAVLVAAYLALTEWSLRQS